MYEQTFNTSVWRVSSIIMPDAFTFTIVIGGMLLQLLLLPPTPVSGTISNAACKELKIKRLNINKI